MKLLILYVTGFLMGVTPWALFLPTLLGLAIQMTGLLILIAVGVAVTVFDKRLF